MRTKTRMHPVSAAPILFLGGLFAALMGGGSALAYTPLLGHADLSTLTGDRYQVRWNLAQYPSGIPYLIQTDSQGGGTPDISANTEIDILRSAFDHWASVPTAGIQYKFNGTSENTGQPGQLTVGRLDNINVVGFVQDPTLARAGVVALTLPVCRGTSPDPGLAGQLIEADILLVDDPLIQWLASGPNVISDNPGERVRLNLEEVVTREVGTFNGLQASFVRESYEKPLFLAEGGIIYLDRRKGPFARTALMYPYVLNGSPVRGGSKSGVLLSADEIAGLSMLYPNEQSAASLGTITGQVTLLDPSTIQSATLCGAHVMAVAPGSYAAVASTLTDPDGNYALKGLPAGNYLIWVEPSSPANVEGLYAELGQDSIEFLPEFYGGLDYSSRAKAPTVTVRANLTTPSIDVTVVKAIPNSEVTYALGGQVDQNGDRLIVKVEPDDTLAEATNLRDVNRDGILIEADVIQEDGDVDVYQFQAVRDDVWCVQVIAQAIGSPLVPKIEVLGPGRQENLLGSDEGLIGPGGVAGTGEDAQVIFTAPETEAYYVRISDVSGEGGARFFYTLQLKRLSGRIPISPLSPALSVLSIPISDADLDPAFTNPTFGNVEITEIRVQFLDVDGDGGLDIDPNTGLPADFLDPTIGGGFGAVTSGFSLFKDTGTINGIFDLDPANPDQSEQDSSVRLAEVPTITDFGFGFEVTFKIGDNGSEPLRIPAQYVQDDIADLHVVIRSSLKLHHGDDFQVVIPRNGIKLQINGVAGTQSTTLFPNEFPPLLERNKYTGDLVELTTFIADGASDIDAKSIDFPIIGLNVLGDPAEHYWVSEVEVTFVGFNLLNVIPFAQDRFFGGLPPQLPDNLFRSWQMTDLLPFTEGDSFSGGVNLYYDNDPPGDPEDGVPNFGLNGDLLLGLAGSQRFEVIPIEEVPDDVLIELYPQIFSGTFGDLIQDVFPEGSPPESRAFFEEAEFLELRNELNLFAFKAILPLDPSPALAVPPDDTGVNQGPDIFITIRTSEDIEALDTFVPYIRVDGVKISSDLPDVIANGGDPSAASIVNAGSLRKIDPTTTPNTSQVIVRPGPSIFIKDMVNPDDPNNRGAVIGAVDVGSPPLAVLGIDASAFGSDAMRSPNPAGIDATDLLNTGVTLDSLTILIDPVSRPTQITPDFLQPVLVPVPGLPDVTFLDPDLLGLARNGMTLHVDDGTPPGDFQDNDLDGLFDEELVNNGDDDLDGRADENDFGDEDGVGIQGQLDPTDDIVAYLHNNDIWRGGGLTFYLGTPVVTQVGNSLQITYSDLVSQVQGETVGDFTLVSDPFSIFIDDPFVRTDHFPMTLRGGGPVFNDNPTGGVLQNGFYPDFDEVFIAEGGLLFDDIAFNSVTYSYVTQIPNSNTIPELQGADFFVAMRAGPAALSGDNFRMRIPADGIGFSYFRDPNGDRNRPGTFPSLDFSSNQVRVGTGNEAPNLTFLAPAGGENDAQAITDASGIIQFQFDVQFNFNDSDNDAVADFYFDTDNFGIDGQPIPTFPLLQGQQTSNVVDNDGARPLEFTFQFPPELTGSGVSEVYIYAIVTDDVNPTKAVYSSGSIVISATNRGDFAIQDFLIADNVGRLFGTGGANVNIPDFRQSKNIIRDLELTPSERGALFLNGFGEVVLRGDPDPWADFVRTSDTVRFPGSSTLNFGLDLARDLVADFRNNGYYVLDGMGTVHPVGNVPPDDFPLLSQPIHQGQDLARDLEPTASGEGLFILSGDGAITSLGDADTLEPAIVMGMDIARDMEMTASGRGAYVLDGFGNILTVGDARRSLSLSRNHPIFMGSDEYRAMEIVPGGAALLVMDRQGQVFRVGNVVLGPNPIQDNSIPPPPGFREGEPIDFTSDVATGNVITGEAFGSFVDLETVGLGSLATSIEDFILSGTGGAGLRSGLCGAILTEDLNALLDLFLPEFEDAQGHDIGDLAEMWKSFFDYYDVVLCRIPGDASLTVLANPERSELISIFGFMELLLLNPVLTTLAPADDPLELDNPTDPDALFGDAGEIFTFGPIQYDQVVRFGEIGDGRGWEMNIIDDDYVEAQIDPADRHLVNRHFFKERSDRREEGRGTVFLAEEDGNQNSNNSEYIFQFIENVEATSLSPEGGWNQPVLNVLWSDLIGDELPLSTVLIPFQFDILLNTEADISSATAILGIIGGQQATFSVIPEHSEDEDALEQNSNNEILDEMPGGWRFFDNIGVHADQRLERYYESHLFFNQNGDFGGWEVPDPNSSAFIVNLTEVNWIFPNDTTRETPLFGRPQALDPDLVITPEEFDLIPISSFLKSVETVGVPVPGAVGAQNAAHLITPDDPPLAVPTDFLVTFRGDELRRPDRIYYATYSMTMINNDSLTSQDPDNPNNAVTTATILWKFDPETDFITGNSFKRWTEKIAEKNKETPKPKKPRSAGPLKRFIQVPRF